MHCFRANTWYRSENPRAVCVFVSPVLIPSSTNRRVDHFHPMQYLSHLPAGIFYYMPLRKIKTQRNHLRLWSKIIRKASLAHHKFFLALKRDQIEVCTLNIRGLKYDFFSTLSLLSFTQNVTQFTQLRTKTRTSISRQNLLCKVGIALTSARV